MTNPAASHQGLDPVDEQLRRTGRERQFARLDGRERLVRGATAVIFLAAAIPLAVLSPGGHNGSLLVTLGLIAAYVAASSIELEVGTGVALPTELVLVPMLYLLPPGRVPLYVAAALLVARGPRHRGVHPTRAAVEIGNAIFALGPAAVFVAFGSPSALTLHGWAILPLALAAQFAVDFVTSAGGVWIALGVRPRGMVGPLLWVFGIDALLAPIGLAAASAASIHQVAAFLPLPLLALVLLFARERRQRLERMLELSTAYRGTAFLLGDVIEADDAYTGSHSRDVVDLVLAVCGRLGVDARGRRLAEFAALLHDVGKIRVPAEIINKPGDLTDDERAIINRHTIWGQELLSPIGGLLAEVGTVVRSCHERHDGLGYPDGLAGIEIPLVARIVSACDAFNAMTTDRPYRSALSKEVAREELRRNRGTQFDPQVVDALLAVIAEG